MRSRDSRAELAKPLLLVDVETTGVDSSTDCIIQLAAVLLEPRELSPVRKFSTRVQTDRPISPDAYAVHGVSSSDLYGEPDISTAMEAFDKFADHDAIITGHNVAFDYAFIKAAYSKVNLVFDFDYHTVDIWSIAFFVLGADGIALPHYNLDYLCGLYGIERGSQHDAMEDVNASAQILKYLFEAVRGKDLQVLGQYKLILWDD